MCSSDLAIAVSNLSKKFDMYAKPSDRLKQFSFSKLFNKGGNDSKSHFQEFYALKNISFEILKGETVGIIGVNGSGKSTLLQLICGTLTPTSGDVAVAGRVAALLELGAGFNPEFTGRENVYMNAAVLGLAGDEIDSRMHTILEFADIGHFIDQPVKTYSSGMLVRLAFSVAINVGPEILIVDEALAVGDARFQSKCLNKIQSMRKSGVTILFVSHDMSSVRKLCDKVIWLDNGQVREQGDVTTVSASYLEMIFSEDTSPNSAVTEGNIADNYSGIKGAVAQWGTHVGSILSVMILDENDERTNVIEHGLIRIKCRFRVPVDADKKNLHFAVSIKNLAGLDLIVRSTHDEPLLSLLGTEDVTELMFTTQNILNSGEYMLSIGLEDRSKAGISYYEYIDGAYYFRSVNNQSRFGLVVPEFDCGFCVQ